MRLYAAVPNMSLFLDIAIANFLSMARQSDVT